MRGRGDVWGIDRRARIASATAGGGALDGWALVAADGDGDAKRSGGDGGGVRAGRFVGSFASRGDAPAALAVTRYGRGRRGGIRRGAQGDGEGDGDTIVIAPRRWRRRRRRGWYFADVDIPAAAAALARVGVEIGGVGPRRRRRTRGTRRDCGFAECDPDGRRERFHARRAAEDVRFESRARVRIRVASTETETVLRVPGRTFLFSFSFDDDEDGGVAPDAVSAKISRRSRRPLHPARPLPAPASTSTSCSARFARWAITSIGGWIASRRRCRRTIAAFAPSRRRSNDRTRDRERERLLVRGAHRSRRDASWRRETFERGFSPFVYSPETSRTRKRGVFFCTTKVVFIPCLFFYSTASFLPSAASTTLATALEFSDGEIQPARVPDSIGELFPSRRPTAFPLGGFVARVFSRRRASRAPPRPTRRRRRGSPREIKQRGGPLEAMGPALSTFATARAPSPPAACHLPGNASSAGRNTSRLFLASEIASANRVRSAASMRLEWNDPATAAPPISWCSSYANTPTACDRVKTGGPHPAGVSSLRALLGGSAGGGRRVRWWGS